MSPYVVIAAVVVVGLLLFVAAMGARALLAPKAPTRAKLTTYESGVDPVGRDWAQTQVRYFVYAFLYVIFAVDAVYLFPWALVVRQQPRGGLAGGDRGLRRGPAGRPRPRRSPWPAEVAVMATTPLPMPRVGLATDLAPQPIRVVLNWGRRYSLWVFNFGLACCAIEFIAASMARHDFIRLGVIPFAPGPRQADLMVVSRHGHRQDGARRAAPLRPDARAEVRHLVRRLLQLRRPLLGLLLASPRASTRSSPSTSTCPGCPPRPEALLQGILKLQEKIAAETLSTKGIRAKYAGHRTRLRGRGQPRRWCRPQPGRRPTGTPVSDPSALDARRGRPGRLGRDDLGGPRRGLHLLRLAHGGRPDRRRAGAGPRRRLPPDGRLHADGVAAQAVPHPRPRRVEPGQPDRRSSAGWPGTSARPTRCSGSTSTGFDDGTGLGLRPLLLPDGFEGTPLRKSFVLAARASKPWPGAKEPGESEHAKPTGRRRVSAPGVPDPEWGPR